jgi:transcriptional regulator with XRE-family HTH domain
MSFGRNLQELREKAGLSQSELAKKANVSIKSLQNWEIDRNQPRLDAIVKLAQVLGVSLEALTSGVGASKTSKSDLPPKATPPTPPAEDLEATEKKTKSRRKKG